MAKIKARGLDDPALDPKAQARRYGRSWETLSRWMKNEKIGYPAPDFYVAKTPYHYLSTLLRWEDSRPTQSPGPAVIKGGPADDFAEAS